MKKNCLWTVIVIFGFTTCLLLSFPLAAEEKSITVTGVIQKSNRITYVTTSQGKYRLIGQDFSKLIGKKLKVTGNFKETSSGKTILVTYMEFIRN